MELLHNLSVTAERLDKHIERALTLERDGIKSIHGTVATRRIGNIKQRHQRCTTLATVLHQIIARRTARIGETELRDRRGHLVLDHKLHTGDTTLQTNLHDGVALQGNLVGIEIGVGHGGMESNAVEPV